MPYGISMYRVCDYRVSCVCVVHICLASLAPPCRLIIFKARIHASPSKGLPCIAHAVRAPAHAHTRIRSQPAAFKDRNETHPAAAMSEWTIESPDDDFIPTRYVGPTKKFPEFLCGYCKVCEVPGAAMPSEGTLWRYCSIDTPREASSWTITHFPSAMHINKKAYHKQARDADQEGAQDAAHAGAGEHGSRRIAAAHVHGENEGEYKARMQKQAAAMP